MLVDDGGAGTASPWERSPVPAEHQIRGLGPIVLTVHELSRTAFVLTEVMNMRRVRDYAAARRADPCVRDGRGKGSGPAAELHVLEDKDIARRAAGRRRRAPRRVPHARRGAVSRLDAAAERTRASPTAARSTASISAASISASPTAYCSRSPPTARGLRPTSRWRRSVRNWRCRRFWSRAARRSRRG